MVSEPAYASTEVSDGDIKVQLAYSEQLRDSYLAKIQQLYQSRDDQESFVPDEAQKIDGEVFRTSDIPDSVALEKLRAYQARIEFLKNEAREDGELWNYSSEYDFWYFIGLSPKFRAGDLILMDNGNLRAIWDEGPEDQIGLQFLGDGIFQYVIFKHQSTDSDVVTEYGQATFEGLKEKITTFALNSMLYE